MVMGLYTGELIFGGGAYIRNSLSVGEMVGLYLGGLIFGGAYIWGGLIFGGLIGGLRYWYTNKGQGR